MIEVRRLDRELTREYVATGREAGCFVTVVMSLPVLMRKDHDLLMAHMRELANRAVQHAQNDLRSEDE